MNITKFCICVMISMVSGKLLTAQSVNDSVFQPGVVRSFQLINAGNGKTSTLKNMLTAEPLVLFVFLSPECPLCKNYMPVLNVLQQQYGQTVKIIGIFPGNSYTAPVVSTFAQKYKTGFPLFIDPLKKLTSYLHASITPEVVLLDSQYELVYKGAIDNRVKQLGLKRWQATEHYLGDAVSQYLQHTNIAVKRIEAIGCLINDF
jgi:thiol-disulfide isomerase/thioredoxin